MDLEEKTVVVTGGGAGIGRAGALRLAEAGARIVVADRDLAAGQGVADEITAEGRHARAFQADVISDEDWESLRDFTVREFGQVDVVWSHAGIGLAGPPEIVGIDSWQRQLDINVLGHVRGVRTFLPEMQRRAQGHFVFTTSGLGLFPEQLAGYGAPYVVCKAAGVAYARTLHPYLRERGVGVSLFAPDITATAHTFETPVEGMDREALTAGFDLAALQQPEDAAARLVQGLTTDEFLISCVPHTAERLLAAATHLFDEPVEVAGATR